MTSELSLVGTSCTSRVDDCSGKLKAQVAQRILERQRTRLQRYASLEPQAKRSTKTIRVGNKDPTASPSLSRVISSADIRSTVGVDATAVCGRATGRTPFRATMGDSKVLGVGSNRRSRSSPALSTSGGSKNIPCFPKTRPIAIGRAGERGEKEGGPYPWLFKKSGDQPAERSSSIVQQCFKDERASFIRDLQVLHRQLEAKDRESSRREKECRAAVARARLEARSAKEQADVLRAEAEKAVAARATVEATAQDLNDTVGKHSANAEVKHREEVGDFRLYSWPLSLKYHMYGLYHLYITYITQVFFWLKMLLQARRFELAVIAPSQS